MKTNQMKQVRERVPGRGKCTEPQQQGKSGLYRELNAGGCKEGDCSQVREGLESLVKDELCFISFWEPVRDME